MGLKFYESFLSRSTNRVLESPKNHHVEYPSLLLVKFHIAVANLTHRTRVPNIVNMLRCR